MHKHFYWMMLPLFIVSCAVRHTTQSSKPIQIPVPVMQTIMGTMPGMNDLPVRKELPDVMIMDDGQRVTTLDQWKQRREQIKRTLEYYAIGLMPPAPGNVTGRQIKSEILLDGKVNYSLVHLTFGPEGKLGFDIAIFTPGEKTGPYSTVIQPSFGPTPGAHALPKMPRVPEQGHGVDALTLPLGVRKSPVTTSASRPSTRPDSGDPATVAGERSELFRRGYALVTYHYEDCGEDTIARNLDGSWAFRNTRFFPAYPGYDWGLLASWAWGMSRCADYLQTQSFVGKLIVVGHSRLGKATLIAGAFDDRFAVVAPAGSGAGGTGAYRFNGAGRGGKEGLNDMMRKYPNWFSPHLHEFARHVDQLPFDQHWFIALVAPRPFISLDGREDQTAVTNAMYQACINARPAYAFFHATDRLGVNVAPHRHELAAADWAALLDFCDQQLDGKKISRRFDQFPADAHPQ